MYGLRRQMAGHIPSEIEATITITGKDGQARGRLKLDTDDIARLSQGISQLLDNHVGPWERADVDRLLSEYDNT